MGWYSESPFTWRRRKKKIHKAKPNQTLNKLALKDSRSRKIFLKKFIVYIFFQAHCLGFHNQQLMNMSFYDVNKGTEENGKLCSSGRQVTCFRGKARSKPGYKSPVFAYSMPTGFTKKENLSKNSRAKILKMRRPQLPKKQAKQVA